MVYLTITTLYHGSTWVYLTLLGAGSTSNLGGTVVAGRLYYTLPWFYLALLDSTTLYHGSTWFYLNLVHCSIALTVSI